MTSLPRWIMVSLALLTLSGCARRTAPPLPSPGTEGPGMSAGGPGMESMEGMEGMMKMMGTGGVADDSPLVGTKAADFTLPSASGGAFTLSETLRDQYVLIYFYKGSW